ncbi:MAG: hypothetical protein EOL98_10570 [Negativicutes bacterium]|nr:hypothetical protein [Negativicutes bacterium]
MLLQGEGIDLRLPPSGAPTFLFGGGKQESRPFGRLSSGIQESFEAFISGGADQDRTDDLLNAMPQ